MAAVPPPRACTAGLEDALDGLERELRCPICLSWLERPKMLDVCKHLFCAGCLDQHFATEGGRKGCPVCGEASSVRSPDAMKEEDMVTQLDGDMSPLAIETAPPREAMPWVITISLSVAMIGSCGP